MKFEWDENKNLKNIEKHGIPFAYASLVFDDEHRVEKYDVQHSQDEDRYNVIGMVNEILFVVVTYRKADTIRIISAILEYVRSFRRKVLRTLYIQRLICSKQEYFFFREYRKANKKERSEYEWQL